MGTPDTTAIHADLRLKMYHVQVRFQEAAETQHGRHGCMLNFLCKSSNICFD
jgi:hypothetical protein